MGVRPVLITRRRSITPKDAFTRLSAVRTDRYIDSLLGGGISVGVEGLYSALVGSFYIVTEIFQLVMGGVGIAVVALVATLGGFEIYRNFLEYAQRQTTLNLGICMWSCALGRGYLRRFAYKDYSVTSRLAVALFAVQWSRPRPVALNCSS